MQLAISVWLYRCILQFQAEMPADPTVKDVWTDCNVLLSCIAALNTAAVMQCPTGCRFSA